MYDFDSIIGHNMIKEHLKMVLKTGKISHAYIFSGEKGSGKLTMARTFAKTLQCEKNGTNPCCQCVSCLQTDDDNQPDIKILTKEKASYSIREVREQLVNDIEIKPYKSRYKIYIIPEANTLKQDSQNAILKTIEEPPDYAIIILLTENINSFLPTIISRCIVLNFRPVDKELVKNYLIKQGIPDYNANMGAVFSQGNIGKALSYASDESFIEIKNDALKIVKYLDETDEYTLIDSVNDMAEPKDNIGQYFDLFQLWFRDMLLLKTGGNKEKLLFKEEYDTLLKQSESRSYMDIDNALSAITKARQRLEANVYTEVVLEMLIFAFVKKDVS
ncbi:MAG: DNA polymerase III subunit delta [Lachnospiraceae bacterium]|nr:DNA polymerase III subunit delta [Lachnospiraceae bacterium]